DRSVVRALLAALAWQGAALLLLALAWGWRRGRWPLLGVAVALSWCAPWPDAALLTTAATPTSFQTSPAPFSATSIV
ncbi:hypothetical protein, partial [Staphylococcus aureus]